MNRLTLVDDFLAGSDGPNLDEVAVVRPVSISRSSIDLSSRAHHSRTRSTMRRSEHCLGTDDRAMGGAG